MIIDNAEKDSSAFKKVYATLRFYLKIVDESSNST